MFPYYQDPPGTGVNYRQPVAPGPEGTPLSTVGFSRTKPTGDKIRFGCAT
jgi:hypothetical protein